MKRLSLSLLLILAMAFSLSAAVFAQEGGSPVDRIADRALPESISALKLDNPVKLSEVPTAVLDANLRNTEGPVKVIVRLTADSVAEAKGKEKALRVASQEAQAQQNAFVKRLSALDPNAREIARVQLVLNAVFLEIDASALIQLAKDPAVERIARVGNYEMDLSETVPYIGATVVQGLGYDGSGVRVAVLDSGIDYTHAALGGSGDPADFAANDPTIIEAGSFPTAKVIGGYDFVGSDWTGGVGSLPAVPDPDPLDDGSGGGHGTHVGHIIGGIGGVAPGASLYAVKVCSSVSTACSGIALIQGMEFAVDPDGNDNPSDAVDVINMSLGSDYGQAFDDDLSAAVDNATTLGVLTVASAGNGSDKPYIVGTPSTALSALSVAQTSVPSAIQIVMEVVSPAAIAGSYAAVFQPWSFPLTSLKEAPVQYGDGAGGNLLGCDPFAASSLSGMIVLVDRGDCNFSLKIKNIGDAGGLAGVIGMVAPGDPFEGSWGGDEPITIPGFMISQDDSDTIKGFIDTGVVAQFDPEAGLPLIQHMVGYSSRGPSMLTNLIKPEIGAPGASMSAVAGTGTEEEAFGGTSGAAPMVTGSAALLLEAFPNRPPLEIKAVLMNTAETDIMNKPALFGGYQAAITRIGGGEVRVDQAADSPAAAWDSAQWTGALSFGFHDVTEATLELTRTVTVHNYSTEAIVYAVTPTFRYAEDETNGAISFTVPEEVTVPAQGEAVFEVSLTIDGTLLREWGLDSGANGANPDVLTQFEYDGYLLLDDTSTPDDDADPLHMAWQVLPRLSANVSSALDTVKIDGEVDDTPAGFVTLSNEGVGTARIDTYSLIGKSPDLPEGEQGENAPIIDLRYVGVATYPVPAGYCSADESFVMGFAVNTWERQTHAIAPAAFEFDLDVNQDGLFDYAVINLDASMAWSDGRNVTWVVDLTTFDATGYFYTDHGTNSGNTALYFCGEQIGMNATNFFQPIDMLVGAYDTYFTGNLTDYLDGITFAPLGERYLGLVDDIVPGGDETLTVLDYGYGPDRTETGILLLLDAARDDIRGGAPPENEAIALKVIDLKMFLPIVKRVQ